MNVRAARFPLFDSLRAIAVLLVFGYHIAPSVIEDGSPLRQYTANLNVGVSIFFVVSGFLLYRPFVRARVDGKRWIPLRSYAWRRFVRIVPPYWVALLVWAIVLGSSNIFTFQGIPRYWLFGQIYDPFASLTGIAHAWSLDVEMAFYVFLAVVAFTMRGVPGRDRGVRLRTEWLVVGLIFVAGIAFNVLAIAGGAMEPLNTELQWLPSFFEHFAFGMGLAVATVATDGLTPRPLRFLDRYPGIAWGVAFGAFWVVSTRLGGQTIEEQTGAQFFARRELFAVIAVCVVVPAVFGEPERGLVRRLLGMSAPLWVGLISYSFFLYHPGVITMLNRHDVELLGHLHRSLFAVDALALSLLLAAAGYYLIERPAMSLKHLFDPPVEPQPGEATAEPAPATPLTSGLPGRVAGRP
jgi:peptidoglycan/LPS O-acetylase OafA/YrhL